MLVLLLWTSFSARLAIISPSSSPTRLPVYLLLSTRLPPHLSNCVPLYPGAPVPVSPYLRSRLAPPRQLQGIPLALALAAEVEHELACAEAAELEQEQAEQEQAEAEVQAEQEQAEVQAAELEQAEAHRAEEQSAEGQSVDEAGHDGVGPGPAEIDGATGASTEAPRAGGGSAVWLPVREGPPALLGLLHCCLDYLAAFSCWALLSCFWML